MPRAKVMTEARLSKALLDDYNGYRSEWATQMQINEDYFHNKQWTDEEVEDLAERGQFPLTINKITPILLQKIAQLGEHRPTLKALPLHKAANQQAVLWSHMIEYVLQQSEFPLVDLAVKQAHAVKGIGWYHVFIDDAADDGRGEVKVGQEQPQHIWVDPNSRKPDFSDADHIIICKELTFNQALQMFPNEKKKLNKAATKYSTQAPAEESTDSYDEEGYFIVRPGTHKYTPINDARKVMILERYSKVVMNYWVVRNVAGKFMRVVPEKAYNDQFRNDPAWRAVPIKRRRVVKTISAGEDVLLGTYTLPTEHYPLIPIPNYWTGTPFPISDITYLRGMQDEVNKRRSLLILNAALASSNKWLYEKGSIDEEVWNQSAALPNAKLPYKFGYNAPIPVQPMPIPSALAYLEETAKHDMEAMAGSFAVSHGDASQAPDTYAATMAIEEFGARRLAPSLEMFNHAKSQLGRVIISFAQHLYKMPKFIRIVGSKESELVEFYVNERRVDPDTNNIVVFNEVDGGRYDVVIASGHRLPTNRTADFLMYKDLFTLGAIDNQALLEQTDLKDRDEIIKRMSMISQQRNVIEAQQEEIKQLQGIVMTMRRQAIQLAIKGVVQEYRMLEKSKLLDIEAKARLTQQLMDLQAKEHQMDLEMIEKEAALAVEREKVQRQASLLPAPSSKSKEN